MTNDEKRASEREIKSDEDWKERVKAEDARLDAERAQKPRNAETTSSAAQPGAGPAQQSAGPAQLPKPEFATLVGMFSTQAMVALGILAPPDQEQVERELPLARHFIDLLGVLEEKTKGNLTDGERKLLEQSLHELRMVYVELSRREAADKSHRPRHA